MTPDLATSPFPAPAAVAAHLRWFLAEAGSVSFSRVVGGEKVAPVPAARAACWGEAWRRWPRAPKAHLAPILGGQPASRAAVAGAVPPREPSKAERRAELARFLAARGGPDLAAVLSRRRSAAVVAARIAALRHARATWPDLSIAGIGRLFGIHHATVLHHLKKGAGR